MSRKKTKNPFKMKGSYMGALLLPLFSSLFLRNNIFDLCLWTFTCSEPVMMFDFGKLNSIVFYSLFIVGFLLGWGITLLWRKFRK